MRRKKTILRKDFTGTWLQTDTVLKYTHVLRSAENIDMQHDKSFECWDVKYEHGAHNKYTLGALGATQWV